MADSPQLHERSERIAEYRERIENDETLTAEEMEQFTNDLTVIQTNIATNHSDLSKKELAEYYWTVAKALAEDAPDTVYLPEVYEE